VCYPPSRPLAVPPTLTRFVIGGAIEKVEFLPDVA